MKCVKPKPTDLLIVDIFVHVIILLGILLAFFVLFISKLETSELEDQIKSQIDQNIPTLYDNINKKPPGVFKNLITQLNTGDKDNPSVLSTMHEYYSKPDSETQYKNKFPIIGALIVLLALIAGLFAVWSILKYSCNKNIPIKTIIFENIVLFGCIGIIEVIFFQNIAMHYVPTKPSYFVNKTLDSLKAKF